MKPRQIKEKTVVVFDETAYGLRKPKEKTTKKAPKNILSASSATKPSKTDAVEDAEDILDMEVSQLWDRLKTTVEDIAGSGLTGRERRAHLLAKVVNRGGHPEETPHAPFKVRMGMRVKAKERRQKAKVTARETDNPALMIKRKS